MAGGLSAITIHGLSGMIDLPDWLDSFWSCCLQLFCTADKMLCQQTAGPACTESFERGVSEVRLGRRSLSQVRFIKRLMLSNLNKQLCFLGDAAQRTLLLLRNTTVTKGHHFDPKCVLCPLIQGQWVKGEVTTVGRFDCHEMCLKGKKGEFAQEKKSKIYHSHPR